MDDADDSAHGIEGSGQTPKGTLETTHLNFPDGRRGQLSTISMSILTSSPSLSRNSLTRCFRSSMENARPGTIFTMIRSSSSWTIWDSSIDVKGLNGWVRTEGEMTRPSFRVRISSALVVTSSIMTNPLPQEHGSGRRAVWSFVWYRIRGIPKLAREVPTSLPDRPAGNGSLFPSRISVIPYSM